jgi:predicted Zn-dependent protease
MNTFAAFSPRRLGQIARIVSVTALTAGTGAMIPRAVAVSEPSALTGQKQNYAYSWEQEIKEGADADKEITQQMGLYDNPDVQAYVQAVGQRVLAASTFADATTPEMYRQTKFTFRVLDSSVVNAFALPGGYVYVTRGLLAHVDNEAQLAVVLGHEIGHVAARHASQQARRSQWSQIGLELGAALGQAVLGDRMPNLASNVMNTGSQAMQVFLLRYSREAETQADTLGVTYASRAGYAAADSARFFAALQRLAAQDSSGLPTWMSSHPDPGNRAAHVLELANADRAGNKTRGEEELLRHIDGLVIGNDPRQGFASNGVFYHPTLHFQVPVATGWKVDNQPDAVVFTDPNGRGVLGLKLASASRTHDAATQFVSQNNVQVVANGDTMINGLPATVIIGQAAMKDGTMGVWDAFVELDGKVYSLLGYAPPQSFEQLRPTFESVAAGFSRLRDPRLASVQPTRLRIVRADRTAPFAAFVPTSLPPDFKPETLAIMNQVALNETVPQGTALKVPTPSTEIPVAPASTMASPPTTTYPDAQTYPSTSTSYPSAPANPSSTYPSYPPSSSNPYPNYPSQPTYPTATPSPSTTYPDANNYPPNYPQSSSNPNYPPQQTYPQQYPQTQYPATQYPPVQYPSPQYPNQGAPQYPQRGTSYPQFPQPPQQNR